MAVEIAEAYVSLIPSAQGFADKVSDELGGSLDDAGKKGGEKISSGLFSGLGGKAATAGLAVGASLGAGVAAAGAGLFALGSTFDDAFDAIRVQTGATGDALGGLTDSFKSVFASVPTTSGDAAAAIGTLNQKLGLTGKPLEALSTQLLNLSRITETDLNANLKGAVDVFNSFGVAAEDQPERLDQLFRASQATGTSVDTLAATMASAGPNLQQLGLSFEQSAALLGVFGKAGVDAGAIMPALSKSIVEAAKSGKSAGDVFRGTFDAIRNAPDDTAAAGAAIEVFGAKAGPKLAGLIRQGKLGYEELAASIAGGGDTINAAAEDTADFAEQWGTFKNKILVGLEPIASGVFGAVGDAMAAIGPKVGPVISEITGGFSAFFAAFKAGDGDVTSSGFPGFMERLANGARQVFDAIKGIDFAELFGRAKEILTPVVDALGELAAASFDTLKSSLETVIQLFKDNKDTIFAVLDAVKVGLTAAIDVLAASFRFLADHMGLVKAVAVPLLAAFVGFKVVSGIFSAITLATKAWTAVQAAFNVVMSLNPIGLVVAAIAALVAGVVYAYTHFETFRNIVDGFFDVIQAGFAWVVTNWQTILAVLTGPIGIAAKLIIDHWEGVKGAFVAAFNWVRDNWPLILAILTGPIGLAVLAITKNWDTIRDTFGALVGWISDGVGRIVSFFAALPGRIVGALGDIGGWIWSVFQNASNRVAGTVEQIVGFYLSLPGRILSAIGNVGSLLYNAGLQIGGSLLSGIANSLRAGFDFAGAIVGNIAGAVRGAINSVIDELNWAIPNHFGWGPVGFDIPANPIPRLAQGGIVTRATLAMIGERGPEAVIPLGSGVGFGGGSDRKFRDLIINTLGQPDAQALAREVTWAQKTQGVEVMPGVNIAYRGLQLDAAPYSVEHVEGLMGTPQIRSTDQPYIGRSGLVKGRDFYEGRTVTITLAVYTTDLTAFGFAVEDLSAAFVAPIDDEFPLTFTIPGIAGGFAARLDCRPRHMSLPQPQGEWFNGVGRAVIELFATDPRKYAYDLSSVVVTVETGLGGFQWPFDWPLTWPGVVSETILTNYGNSPVWPAVRFDGPLTNPGITNLNTQQTVSLAMTIAAGDWVDVDFATRSVLINGAVNRYPYLDEADWWEIPPGNTSVALSADIVEAGTATITWRSGWL